MSYGIRFYMNYFSRHTFPLENRMDGLINVVDENKCRKIICRLLIDVSKASNKFNKQIKPSVIKITHDIENSVETV